MIKLPFRLPRWPGRRANPSLVQDESRMRASNPSDAPDPDACGLTVYEYGTTEADLQRRLDRCGPGAPTLAQVRTDTWRSGAARRLSERRWTLPKESRWVQAKHLR